MTPETLALIKRAENVREQSQEILSETARCIEAAKLLAEARRVELASYKDSMQGVWDSLRWKTPCNRPAPDNPAPAAHVNGH